MGFEKERYVVSVIDDEENILTMISMALKKEKCQVHCSSDPESVISDFDAIRPDVVITDIKMPGMSGVDVLHRVKKLNPQVNVILMTAFASVDTAVEAIRGGAFDYLVKPFKINDLRDVVRRALSTKRFSPSRDVRKQLLVGQSAEIADLKKMVLRIAQKDSTVLIEGESGTGKELVAQMIHSHSSRKTRPFVSVNCAALTETLLESELFGFEKGSFTGANTQKIGLFEYADGGTLLLDEVGEMSETMQMKLLRVLQEREIKRVGGVDPISVDVRVISATNKILRMEVEGRRFREDLFYRLNVVPIRMPALREHATDIAELVSHFVAIQNEKHVEPKKLAIDAEVLAVWQTYGWNGNVRELEHCVERLYVMTDEEVVTMPVLRDVFGDGFFSGTKKNKRKKKGPGRVSLKDERALFEKEMIEEALEDSAGNKYQAAKKLNMTRQSLQYKLKKYGMI